MKPLKYIILLLFVMAFLHCSNKTNGSKNGYEKIVFGSGGGFTGKVKSYSIDSEGNLFLETEQKKLLTLTKNQLKDLNTKTDRSNILNTSFDKPGNFYYFIEVQKKNTKNKVTWSNQEKASENIIILYQYLVGLVNQNKE